MLDTNSHKHIRRELIIAGQNSGKPVSITPIAEPIYHEMVKLARGGNYWAGLCVNGVHSLVNGRLHQSNIFVKPGAVLKDGREEFVMILPGCKVTVEKLANDGFKVLYFKADLNYFELQKLGDEPGLYRAEKAGHKWTAEFVKSGKALAKDNRLVAIGDGNHKRYKLAARDIAPRLADSPISGGATFVDTVGFDFHYTPKLGSLGGLKNYKKAINPNSNTDVHASALLLAKTMYDARKINGVRWVSEFGGSAVLTQAMTILAAQGIKLDKHYVFLYRPTSAPNKALEAAQAVGLKLDRKFSNPHMFDVIGNQGQLSVILKRLKHEKDYTAFKASADLISQGKSIQGLGTTVATVAGGVGLSMAAPAAILPYLTALGATAALAGKVIGGAVIGANVVEANLPAFYDRVKSKF
ncbi:MAG: hypothetical protein KBT77_10220 [Thalassolituus oleivorans]|uniref:hypothetical protein n=1 Tax=Thalassolituus oleivorans TaxID=187493 RepID=UPI001B655781|nr:hypothetical protein [Thalassolituus oleivorans]MBQ0727710.1 hypothetical protein [Thalassolituus oleivorans]MBQ0780213.1 hypothetical protein [Thalassolituus oleivorans]